MKINKKELLKLINENYSMEEHHLDTRENKIEFILSNQYLSTLPFIHPDELESMPEEEIDSIYNQVEDEMSLGQYEKSDMEIKEPDFSELEPEEELDEENILSEDEINQGNLVNYIINYEQGDLSDDDMIKLFSYLIKSGLAWSLQGSYGRAATRLIDDGFISRNGEILKQVGGFSLNEGKKEKPSAGLTKKKKSEIVKKAKKGEDIGKKGKGFKKVEAKAKESGAKDPKAVAAAAMWKNVKRESVILTKEQIMEQFNKKQDIKESQASQVAQAYQVAMEDIDGSSDEEVAEYLGIEADEVNYQYRQDAIEKRQDYYLELWKKEGLMESTEVAKKHPSVINQERINKETAKETKADRDQTFVKNMDKIVKGNDDFQYVNEPKFDKDSLKKEDILDKNAGAVAEEGLEDLGRGGMSEINYDRTSPEFKERMEKDIDPVKGKRIYANSVATNLGEKINKSAKKKIEDKKNEPMYNKDIQPVKDVKENKGKQLSDKTIDEQTKKIMKVEKKVNKLTEKINKKQQSLLKGTPIKDLLSEEALKELEKMKKLFNYKPNDYIKNK